jgi:flagellar basal body-associated protein FliL
MADAKPQSPAPAAKAPPPQGAPAAAAPGKGAQAKPAPAAAKAPVPRNAPFNVRFQRGLSFFGDGAAILAGGLFAKDWRTRWWTLAFYLSCTGVGLVLYWGHLKLHPVTIDDKSEQAARIGQFFEKQKAGAERREATLELGSFTIELKPLEGAVPKGVVNLAELSLVASCSSREICSFLEARMELVRDQVSSVFVYTERDELMTPQGKRRIKAQIIRKLNALLPSGTVNEIYITKLLLS